MIILLSLHDLPESISLIYDVEFYKSSYSLLAHFSCVRTVQNLPNSKYGGHRIVDCVHQGSGYGRFSSQSTFANEVPAFAFDFFLIEREYVTNIQVRWCIEGSLCYLLDEINSPFQVPVRSFPNYLVRPTNSTRYSRERLDKRAHIWENALIPDEKPVAFPVTVIQPLPHHIRKHPWPNGSVGDFEL